MTTVAIIGAGDIGGAAAQALASADRVGRILLVDDAAGAATGKALDIQQSGAVRGFHTSLSGTNDLSRLVGSSVCVIADRFRPDAGEWRGDEGLALIRHVAAWVPDAPIVFAGASQMDLLRLAATEAGLHRRRLVGSAVEALVSAVAAIVAMEAECSSRDVMLAVLGVPPAGLVVPWSEASIGGFALQEVLSPVQLARIEARTARLWPPGPLALGTAAAQISLALLSSSRRSFSVFAQLGGEFGVRNRPGAVPVRLGPRGIVKIRVPELTTRERVQVQTALER